MQKFTHITGPIGPKIELDGQQYLYFGGTAYLGMPRHKAFLELYHEGIRLFGLNNGTSRNNNVQLGIYNETEAYAAERFGAGAALTTSSGFLAAQFCVRQFAAFGQVRHAPNTHPALWLDGPPGTSGSFGDWAKNIVEEINSARETNWFLISNSMNNLFPEIYDFSFIQNIRPEKKVILLIDDSHGIGINNDGLSALSAIGWPDHVRPLIVASMAKALGVDAGIILGDKDLLAQLRSSSGFLGASPPSAAGLYAFSRADEIYRRERSTLLAHTERLANACKEINSWHFVAGFPVFLSKNVELSENLLNRQILISAFPYPHQDGELLTRIVLSSWHTAEDIELLISTLS